MVYVTGDTHGDISRLSPSALKFMEPGDTLIICGDFGFVWDNSKREDKILRSLGKRRYNICFIDGTHENFGLLDRYPVTKFNGGKVHRISGNLYNLMRGQLYRIDGMSIFTMGGGELPDAEYVEVGDELGGAQLPSRDELLAGIGVMELVDYNVDVIITHEPPAKTREFLLLNTKEEAKVSVLNTFFDELSRQCTYKKWFFGSMHIDKFISSNQIALYKNIVDAKTGMKVK